MMGLLTAIGAGASAVCLAVLSPQIRAAVVATNGFAGAAFLFLAWQIWMLRAPMREQLPAWFVWCAIAFIGLCGMHHTLHGLDVVLNLTWADAVVTGAMAVVTWLCVIATAVSLAPWLEERSGRHDAVNVAIAFNILEAEFRALEAGTLGPAEARRIAAGLRPVRIPVLSTPSTPTAP